MKLLNYIKDFFENAWWRIKDMYTDIRHWWNMCATHKSYWKLLKTTFKSYPYDYCYLLELEQAKLHQLEDYFKSAKIISDESYAHILKYIRLSISLLDIIMDKVEIYDFVDAEPNEQGAFKSAFENKYIKYHSNVYVNMRNAKRFVTCKSNEDLEHGLNVYKKWPCELYIAKAINLYNQIRKQELYNWWD